MTIQRRGPLNVHLPYLRDDPRLPVGEARCIRSDHQHPGQANILEYCQKPPTTIPAELVCDNYSHNTEYRNTDFRYLLRDTLALCLENSHFF